MTTHNLGPASPIIEGSEASQVKKSELNKENAETKQNFESSDILKNYTTGPFEIKKINPAVEEAIKYLQREGKKNRRALDYITSNKYAGIKASATISPPMQQKLPMKASAERVVKKVTFGSSSIVHFKDADVFGGSVNRSALAATKSIIKRRTFKSPNTDFEAVGKGALQCAIARLYNLCDLPLTIFKKDDPILSLELLARGVGNAFKSHEVCWKRVRHGELESKDAALELLQAQIKMLETENKTLGKEMRDIKQELETDLNKTIPESQKKMEGNIPEIRNGIVKMGILKLDLIDTRSKVRALNYENEALKQENEKIRLCLQGQREESQTKKLLSGLEVKRKLTEQKRLLNDQGNDAINGKLRQLNRELNCRLEATKQSNAKLTQQNRKLTELNEYLRKQTGSLEGSLAITKKALLTSLSSERTNERVSLKLINDLKDCQSQITQLSEHNRASELSLTMRIKQWETKYAQVVDENQARNHEAQKSESEGKDSKRGRAGVTATFPRSKQHVDTKSNLDPAKEPHVSTRQRILKSMASRIHLSSSVYRWTGT